jgi:small subunit ribosomal protein S19
MPKIFSFHGKNLEEIKSMSFDEFAKMLNSRERRSLLKRGMTDQQKKLLENIKKDPQKFHRTHVRDIVILPQMIGAKMAVFSGKEFQTVDILPDMVGHRLGEFTLNNKRVKHSAPGIGATRGSKFAAATKT